MVYLKSVENVITLGKLIGLLFLFCLPLLSILLLKTPQIRGMTSLALYWVLVVRAISVYSAGVPQAARFTAAVEILLPLATFQF